MSPSHPSGPTSRPQHVPVHLLAGAVVVVLVLATSRLTVLEAPPAAATCTAAAVGALWCRWAGRTGARAALGAAGATTGAVAVACAALGAPALPALLAGVAAGVHGWVAARAHAGLVRRRGGLRPASHRSPVEPPGPRRESPADPFGTPADLAAVLVASLTGAVAAYPVWWLALAATSADDAPAVAAAVGLSAACATLLALSAALSLVGLGRGGRTTRRHGTRPASPQEALVLLLAATGVHLLLWCVLVDVPVSFLALPLSLWLALRAPLPVVSAHVVAASLLVALGTAAGRGPLAGLEPVAAATTAHAFVAVLAVACFALSLSRRHRDVLVQRADRSDAAARERASLLRRAFATAPVGVAVVEVDRGAPTVVREVNAELAELLGRPCWALAGQGVEVLGRVHAEPGPCALDVAARSGGRPRCEHVLAGRPGRPETESRVVVSASRVRSAGGAPHLVVVVQDVSAERQIEQVLRHRAQHDPLTGLAGRELLTVRLQAAVGAEGAGASVLVLDLDGFKAVNDSAGHAVGDELLDHVGARLTTAAAGAPEALVARMGGDEFAVLVPRALPADALRALGEQLVAALEVPVLLTPGVFTVGASVGAQVGYPGADARRLLHEADLAMYAAKRAGGGGVVLHDEPGRWVPPQPSRGPRGTAEPS
ncbi:sensor domain-containing diguanylate cyclase [Pseudokineococcus sp. 1T1Z-3]|uniref:sensor domain-containing diguanylate cyclase n=1 Tax=Pseudokineococcus sp. 1T1Z-3 TaxID=3132745 RepID=UPI0030983EDD